MRGRYIDYDEITRRIVDQVRSTSMGKAEAQHLATLGRVWGFLQYHHPSLASLPVDWDQVLVDAIRDIRTAPDAVHAVLERVIDHAGPPLPPGPATPTNPATAWIARDPLLGPALLARLEAIRTTVRTFNPLGVAPSHRVGNPVFTAKPYAETPDPGVELRLLALIRYWNAINYFFPYRHLIDRDWNTVLEELIPAFIAAPDARAYHLLVKELGTRIDDGHGSVQSAELVTALGARRPRLELRVIKGKTVVAPRDLEHADELAPGDIVLAIGGVPVDELRRDARRYAAASNDAARDRVINRLIVSTNADELTLSLLRGDAVREVVLPTFLPDDLAPRPAAQSWTRLPGDVGYLDMRSFTAADIAPAMSELATTRGLVIDLRAYPEFLLFKLLPYLIEHSVPFVGFSKPDLQQPGMFIECVGPTTGGGRADVYAGKVVVIVDVSTMSRGEYITMALQSIPGAIVVGNQTSGADGNVSMIALPGGITAGMSGLGIYYPDGRPTQRVGIAIDIVVKPTLAGIRDGRDELLERALAVIAAL